MEQELRETSKEVNMVDVKQIIKFESQLKNGANWFSG